MITLIEQAIKTIRAARTVEAQADSREDNTTEREYWYIAAAAAMAKAAQLLAEATAEATTEANTIHAQALATAERRKANAKKQ